ncbi:MaoC/PaaZ C-terminal domain-containing protein [Halomicrococcus gelatinilyticus]|uniref:MaoC/PaaZ C-terminal domain-containing protein n=1 Tax=Halomicrococcus gelatinilyticus TaxID=1702103 RepID=UPI002E0E3068
MSHETATRYFADLRPGETFALGSETVTEEEMLAFADRYDPQPMHTDPSATEESLFDGVVASGWYTVAVSMRRFVAGVVEDAGVAVRAGVAVEELRWPTPVRPGDTLHGTADLLDCEDWSEDLGVARFDLRMRTDDGEVVLELTKQVLVERGV